MKQCIQNRLTLLEAANQKRQPPTFEQFQNMWADLDELSKSLYLLQAENPENIELLNPDESSRQFAQTISAYLQRMGLAKVDPTAPSLRQIAAEMEKHHAEY